MGRGGRMTEIHAGWHDAKVKRCQCPTRQVWARFAWDYAIGHTAGRIARYARGTVAR